jgi:seryl-tRNA synthetase
MPIDINLLRADRGGDPEKWRDVMRKRFKPVDLIDRVIELDQVRRGRGGPPEARGRQL